MPDDLLLGDLEAVIRDYARGDKRSQQKAIGPSELGQDCTRRLALTMIGADKINDNRDEWTSSVGTALHTWMESAFHEANRNLQSAGLPPRWLIEQTVQIEAGLDGHCDVYDLWTHTVLDHKFPGVTSIRKYRRQGHPGRQYIWQAHTYGLGWAKMGFPVRTVAIAMYPRSGLIRDTWLWSEPYDAGIALEALGRKDTLLAEMNVAEHGGQLDAYFAQLPRNTEHCDWCPFYTGGPEPAEESSSACAGPFEVVGYKEEPKAHDMRIPGLLA